MDINRVIGHLRNEDAPKHKVRSMIKADIAEAVFEECKEWGVTKKAAMDFVELTFDIVKQTLTNDQEVKIPNFGVFRTRKKRPRLGRNPKTGNRLMISGRRVVTFKWSKGLYRKLNGESL